MKQETIVRLKIISETLAPEKITDALNIACDESWRSGDERKHTTIIEKNNGWVLNSGLPKTAGLEEHIQIILRKLQPINKKIRHLSSTETVELSCVIYSSSAPPLNFSPAVISQIAELRAGLDIDLYRLEI